MAEEQLTKICTKCKDAKLLSYFAKHSGCKFGVRNICKECTNEKDKEYYVTNKDVIVEKHKKYLTENKEKISDTAKKYYKNNLQNILNVCANYRENNKTKIAEYHIKYYEINKESITEKIKQYRTTQKGKAVRTNSSHNRRNLEKDGDVTSKEMMELQKNAKSCYWCNEPLKNVKVHIDHYNPISKGGEHTLSNLVVSCQSCNHKKHAKDPISFANSIGKLL